MPKVRYGARSEAELRNREVEATSVDVWATTLVATYLTDPAAIAAVLPPPIEPGDEPLVKVTVATVDIPGYPTFGAGSFSVRARHEGTDGYYALFMPMTTEQSVIGGRETFGEPKKLGTVELAHDGDRVVGRVTRMGVTVIEIAGRVADELEPPDEETRTDFYFKFLPAPDGKGFDSDPALVYCHRTEKTRTLAPRRRRRAPARLSVRPRRRPARVRAPRHPVRHPEQRPTGGDPRDGPRRVAPAVRAPAL